MLRSVDEHSGEVRTDPLQVLHIVYNLNDILTLRPAGVGHTLNDSQLSDQVTSPKCFETLIFWTVTIIRFLCHNFPVDRWSCPTFQLCHPNLHLWCTSSAMHLDWCTFQHHSLVHGQVTIIFVVSVCLSVCLFVCLCRAFFSRLQSDLDQTRTHVTCPGLVVFPRI